MEAKIVLFALLLLEAVVHSTLAQLDLAPPYFNIAEKKKVTVNATCGEGSFKKEYYCKLVGYDSYNLMHTTSEIKDGQVCTVGGAEKTHF